MRLKNGIIVIVSMILPVLLFQNRFTKKERDAEITQPIESIVTVASPVCEDSIQLLQADGQINTINMDDYITGVVLAEMPANFEEDALMAQAVAARTYTYKHRKGNTKHENADVCGNASCCQAYMSYETYLDGGGTKESYERIRTAVYATTNEVLTYENELIEATYFSCSGGMTEAASFVWGTEYPYLIAQPSPGEESASVYTDSITISNQSFLSLLGMDTEQNVEIEHITYTDGGGIDKIKISGNTFTGVELRRLLNLRSTSIRISIIGDSVVITTQGYGHRVGMSQHGAEAMAVSGSTYEEILAYYYPGTELVII